jgi:hypothetical protein
MTFNEAIEKIMPDVRIGADDSFIIYRDGNRNWHSDHTRNQYGDTFEWVEDVDDIDPLALEFTGLDFANGSYSYVYDTVLCNRLSSEYFYDSKPGMNANRLFALVNFFHDNIGSLSHKVTDYLTTLERPLSALYEMCPLNLTTDSSEKYYNEDLAPDAIVYIENAANKRLNALGGSLVSFGDAPVDMQINIDEYRPLLTTNLIGWQVTLAENSNKHERYLVERRREPDKGIRNDSCFRGITSDYLEAISEFSNQLDFCVGVANSSRNLMKNLYGAEYTELKSDHCLPDSRNTDYTGKLLIVKASELRPEYRTADSQLMICSHGNGAKPNAKGTSVFGTELFSGEKVCYSRHQIEGIANITKLPEWATKKLNTHIADKETTEKASHDAPNQQSETPLKRETAKQKPTLTEKLKTAKQKVALESAKNAEHGDKPKKRKDMEVK